MKNTALFVASLLFSLFLAELALRAFDVLPYHQRHGLTRGEPQVLDRDADLGWVLRPGRFVWKAPAPGTLDLVFTIGADGERITAKGGAGYDAGRPEIAMIGGSTLFGWGLTDAQTLAWKLQEKLTSFRVRNLGVTAYGTYQSWLALKRRLEAGTINPEIVIYGFIQHHEVRNVAHVEWLKSMYFVNKTRNRGAISLPFITLADDGDIVPEAPEVYTLSPLAETSALWKLIEDTYQTLTKNRIAIAEVATRALLNDINDYCRQRGIAFAVLMIDFSADKFARYAEYFPQHGIEYLDIRAPAADYEKWRLAFDPYDHLGEAAQDYWAEKIIASGILKTR